MLSETEAVIFMVRENAENCWYDEDLIEMNRF